MRRNVRSIRAIKLQKSIDDIVASPGSPSRGSGIDDYWYADTQGRQQVIEPIRLIKSIKNPIFKQSDSGFLTGINAKLYFPKITWVEPIMGVAARAKFYLTYSTDHAEGDGGIGWAISDDPEGPYQDMGLLWVDNAPGNGQQTETGWPVWNPKTQLWHLYYHNQGVGRTQATCLATSPDFENWTRHPASPLNIVPPDYETSGDGHTGYFRPFLKGDVWIAYHLMGGTDWSRSGVSYSDDGITWSTDWRPHVGRADLVDNGLTRKIGLPTSLITLRGNPNWAILLEQGYESGVSGAYGKQARFTLMADDRTPTQLYPAIDPGPDGAWDAGDIGYPNGAFEYNNKLYVPYESLGLDGKGAFGLAIGEVPSA